MNVDKMLGPIAWALALYALLVFAVGTVWAEEAAAPPPTITHGEWAKTHSRGQPLTWHWRRLAEFDVQVVADRPTTLELTFSAPVKLAPWMRQMAVVACSLSVHDTPPASPWDRAPEVPGAFSRFNILANIARTDGTGSDRHKYEMMHISTLHQVPPGVHLVAVYCRARNGNRPGELVELRPEHNSYGYQFDRPEDRGRRGPRYWADGVVELDQDWYDSYDGRGPQSQLVVEVR